MKSEELSRIKSLQKAQSDIVATPIEIPSRGAWYPFAERSQVRLKRNRIGPALREVASKAEFAFPRKPGEEDLPRLYPRCSIVAPDNLILTVGAL